MAQVTLADAPRHPPGDDGLFAGILATNRPARLRERGRLARRRPRVRDRARRRPRARPEHPRGRPTPPRLRSRRGSRPDPARRSALPARARLVDPRKWSRAREGMPGSAIGLGNFIHVRADDREDVRRGRGTRRPRSGDRGRLTVARRDRHRRGHAPTVARGGSRPRPRVLRATSLGLAASFLDQPIEVEELRSRVRSAIGCRGEPRNLLRVGYPIAEVRPTPRRTLEEVLLLD